MSSMDATALKHFLSTLPQTDRYILLLSYADGLSTQEIGLVLDLPEHRVASRLEVLRDEAHAAVVARREDTASAYALA